MTDRQNASGTFNNSLCNLEAQGLFKKIAHNNIGTGVTSLVPISFKFFRRSPGKPSCDDVFSQEKSVGAKTGFAPTPVCTIFYSPIT